ncbi:MAG: GAF domain-containing protein, partial [Bryobacteraceae bacterium]
MGSQVALLQRISKIVSSDATLEKMLNELVSLTVGVTACDACLVYLVDPATADFVLRASQLPHLAEIGNIRLKMGEGVTGWVAEHRSVVALAEHAYADERFKPFHALPEDRFEAFLSVPLVSGGEVTGVINVHHREKHTHSSEEIGLLTFVGEQMGGAIAMSQLAGHSRGAQRRMDALAAVTKAISADAYLDHILESVVNTLASLFDAPECALLVFDEER